MEQLLKEETYYSFESPDGLHHSDLMPEDCMESYKKTGKFGVLEQEQVGDTKVMVPKYYEIRKIYKYVYKTTVTEDVFSPDCCLTKNGDGEEKK